jgi:hypothetical protein
MLRGRRWWERKGDRGDDGGVWGKERRESLEKMRGGVVGRLRGDERGLGIGVKRGRKGGE